MTMTLFTQSWVILESAYSHRLHHKGWCVFTSPQLVKAQCNGGQPRRKSCSSSYIYIDLKNLKQKNLYFCWRKLQFSPASKGPNILRLFLLVAFRFKKAKYMIHFLLRALFKCSVEWVPAKSVKLLIICWDFCLSAHSVLVAAAMRNCSVGRKWEENGMQQLLLTALLSCQLFIEFTEQYICTLNVTEWPIFLRSNINLQFSLILSFALNSSHQFIIFTRTCLELYIYKKIPVSDPFSALKTKRKP